MYFCYERMVRMTDFLASYFMLALGVIFLIVGLYFKQVWLHMFSGGFFAIAGLYYIINSVVGTFTFYLGIFCVLASMPLFLAILWLREKAEPDEIIAESYSDKLDRKTEELYNKRNKGKR